MITSAMGIATDAGEPEQKPHKRFLGKKKKSSGSVDCVVLDTVSDDKCQPEHLVAQRLRVADDKSCDKEGQTSAPVVRARNIAINVTTAMSGRRMAGSDRLNMNTPIATINARMTAMPAISAPMTVEALLGAGDKRAQRTRPLRFSAMRNVSRIATTASARRTTTRKVLPKRPGSGRLHTAAAPTSQTGRLRRSRAQRSSVDHDCGRGPDAHQRLRGIAKQDSNGERVGRCGPSSGCGARGAGRGMSRPHPARRRPPNCPRRHAPAFAAPVARKRWRAGPA